MLRRSFIGSLFGSIASLFGAKAKDAPSGLHERVWVVRARKLDGENVNGFYTVYPWEHGGPDVAWGKAAARAALLTKHGWDVYAIAAAREGIVDWEEGRDIGAYQVTDRSPDGAFLGGAAESHE